MQSLVRYVITQATRGGRRVVSRRNLSSSSHGQVIVEADENAWMRTPKNMFMIASLLTASCVAGFNCTFWEEKECCCSKEKEKVSSSKLQAADN